MANSYMQQTKAVLLWGFGVFTAAVLAKHTPVGFVCAKKILLLVLLR